MESTLAAALLMVLTPVTHYGRPPSPPGPVDSLARRKEIRRDISDLIGRLEAIVQTQERMTGKLSDARNDQVGSLPALLPSPLPKKDNANRDIAPPK
jgi:hypothetical protein